MKRNNMTRRLFPLVLALSMAMSLAPAMAGTAGAEGEVRYPQIIILPNSSVSTPVDNAAKGNAQLRDTLEKRFVAYQIFAGKLSENDYVENRDINELSDIKWGKSINADKAGKLLDDLANDPTPASTLGVTFPLMLEAKKTYLDAPHLETYKEAYNNTDNWEDGEIAGTPTSKGKEALEAAFNEDIQSLAIGDLLTALLDQYQRNAAAAAGQIITDFTPATGNTALARAFYAIVFARDKFSDGTEGNYKYLDSSSDKVVSSTWTGTDTSGYWVIGSMDGDKGNRELEDGYYMIRDVYSEEDNIGKATAAYMAAVFGYGTIEVKAEAPSVNKTIAGSYDGGSCELGETVGFTLTGSLPENFYTAYEGYPYQFIDTMDSGLRFGSISRVYVRVPDDNGRFGFVGAKYDYYEVALDGTNGDYEGKGYRLNVDETGNTVTITFPNLRVLQGKRRTANASVWETETQEVSIPISGKSNICVEYTAWLDEEADIKDYRGNKNTVKLRYANDPIWDPGVSVEGGTWGTAWASAPTGLSMDTVHIFDFGLQIQVKSINEEPLEGAGLALKKPAGSGYALAAAEKPNDFYALAAAEEPDDRYALLHRVETPQADQDAGAAKYTYYLAQWVSQKDLEDYLYPTDQSVTRTWDAPLETGAVIGGFRVPAADEYYAAVLTQDDGLVRVVGLGGGTSYELEEVITPDGYDAADDISVRFTTGYTTSGTMHDLSAVLGGSASGTQVLLSGGHYENDYGQYQEMVVRIPLVNLLEGNLPGTGGMGTTLFYIGGGVLLVAAAAIVILSTVKRKKKDAQ